MAKEDLKVNASINKCRWAKKYIMKHFQGDAKVEFKRLEDHAKEIRRSNRNNSVELDNLTKDGKTFFNRIYMCWMQ